MRRPPTYTSYLQDKAAHKYEMTQSAHELCVEYEEFLKKHKEDLNYERIHVEVIIAKVNGVVVSVHSTDSPETLIEAVKFYEDLAKRNNG